MNAVYIALILAVGAFAGPLFLSKLNSDQRSKERAEDRKVEAQLREEERQERHEVARAAMKAAERTNGVLSGIKQDVKVVHTLVNSDMTTALEGQLELAKNSVILMRRVVEIQRRVANVEPTRTELAEIDAAELRVRDLQSKLYTRVEQNERADEQIEEGTVMARDELIRQEEEDS